MMDYETDGHGGEAIVNGIMFAVCVYGAIFFAWELIAWALSK